MYEEEDRISWENLFMHPILSNKKFTNLIAEIKEDEE